MEIFSYILFYGIPLVALMFFRSTLIKYEAAKKEKVSEEELEYTKKWFRIATIILVSLLIVVFGFIGLLFGAISFM